MNKYRVIDTKGHLLPWVLYVVAEAPTQFPQFFPKQIVFVDDGGNQQALFADQVQDLDLVFGAPKSLLDTLLSEPLPYPLANHFKACSNIRELFEISASGYVLQCIDQVTLSPLERITLRALFEAYLLEIA